MSVPRRVVDLVERERTIIQHQIDATDRQIDRLVHEPYYLTDEEIGIVEQER